MTAIEGAVAAMPVIAILRGANAERFADVADTLWHAGIRAVEFTLTTPGALDAIRSYQNRPGAESERPSVGAGTVLEPSDAQAAVDAGAEYLIAPAVVPETIAAAVRLGVPMLPGASTATEIYTAWRSGAAMVKVFPASAGASYIAALRDPLPQIPLVPTGGVSIDAAADFMRVGAAALGIGSPLLGDVLTTGDLGALHGRAARLVRLLAPWSSRESAL